MSDSPPVLVPDLDSSVRHAQPQSDLGAFGLVRSLVEVVLLFEDREFGGSRPTTAFRNERVLCSPYSIVLERRGSRMERRERKGWEHATV